MYSVEYIGEFQWIKILWVFWISVQCSQFVIKYVVCWFFSLPPEGVLQMNNIFVPLTFAILQCKPKTWCLLNLRFLMIILFYYVNQNKAFLLYLWIESCAIGLLVWCSTCSWWSYFSDISKGGDCLQAHSYCLWFLLFFNQL